MTASIALDLTNLPPPEIVQSATYQEVYQGVLQVFAAFAPDYELFLHSDPAVKVIQAFAYREYLLRGRINEVAKSNLLAYANGADLDQLAAFYGVTRLDGENDTDLRERVRLRITGFSTAGSSASYKYFAITASNAVQDANVSRPGAGIVRVAILSKEGDGTAPQSLLDEVSAVVASDDVRVLTDTVEVVSATIRTVDVSADVWLEPDTPQEVFTALVDNFPVAFEQHRRLGQDITLSWIIAQLHVPGVYRVTVNAPTEALVAGPDDCAALGNLTINYRGRDQ